jgi:hypothetical protein
MRRYSIFILILIFIQILSSRPFGHRSAIDSRLELFIFTLGDDNFGHNSPIYTYISDEELEIYNGRCFGHGSVIIDSSYILIATDQRSAVDPFELLIKGTTDQVITINWGDGTISELTLTGAWDSIEKTYIAKSIYGIRIDHNLDAITEFRINEITLFSILSEYKKMSNLINLRLQNGAIIIGDLSDLSSSLEELLLFGENTITGDLSDLPSGMTYFYVKGHNTITGDIADLPDDLGLFGIYGNNTVSGNIGDLPDDLNYFIASGNNTVSGDIADLPASCSYIWIDGNATVSGDFADVPAETFYCVIRGESQVNTYSEHEWTATMFRIYLDQADGYGLDETEVDNLLIDLSDANWSNVKKIDIIGPNAPRSSASDEAVATLISKGCTVNTN